MFRPIGKGLRLGRPIFAAILMMEAVAALPAAADGPTRTVMDTLGDAVIRRTDPGANGWVDAEAHALPDLIAHTIGGWRPDNPQVDLFVGQWDATADFFRLDIVLAGLVNPPGTVGPGNPFNPFAYGPNPVFGYVEIDMDDETDTGGELAQPHLRYLGQPARFGGLPSVRRYAKRTALDDSAFDGVLSTPPFVDRSGEEFHLALVGSEIESIWRNEEDDMIFGPGERWVLTGRLFHRAHGYELFSYACCQVPPGSYEPVVDVQFVHDSLSDLTTVSLVCPLNNAGSASQRGETVVEPLDGYTGNQVSVLEGMDDLVFSVLYAPPGWKNHPDFPIISKWLDEDPTRYLDPLEWKITTALATSYATVGTGAVYVWTDIHPDVLPGDFDGNGVTNQTDVEAFDGFVSASDGGDKDADGVVDGRVAIINFGPNFSIFDLDYSGTVDGADRLMLLGVQSPPGDFDRDGDVDQKDFARLQTCRGVAIAVPGEPCSAADLDHDGVVGPDDVLIFETCHSGPSIPADPVCTGGP